MMNIGNMAFTEEDYYQVITDKTAVLMEAACRGGAILGALDRDKEDSLALFGFNLGIAFQMTDDVIDYRSDTDVMGKRTCKDIEEGKLTLPMILALKKADQEERTRIESMIDAGRVENGDVAWLRGFLERRGGLDETLAKVNRHLVVAKAQLDVFPGSEEKDALLRLADRILMRTY
jgi:octaprenyl-diphosphate synthase